MIFCTFLYFGAMAVVTRRRQKPRYVNPHALLQWRVRAGFSQAELAKRAKLGQSTISHLETGRSGGTVEVLHRLAEALGRPVDDLMGDVRRDVA